MGQSMQKQGNGEGRLLKDEAMSETIGKCYDKYLKDPKANYDCVDFYRAVSETVAEINKTLGSTQLIVPNETTLRQAYDKQAKENVKLTKEEFQKILQEVILKTGVRGVGAKDMLLYLFGVPITTLFIKQAFIPPLPNEIFIPGITSATVFFLAKFNKI